ncbi:MAG: hypothetical protein VB055_06165 [Oscillospiraceae bacterium]|nr:hypothetical protein [Oscillospiraceae bacterium]
MIKGITVLLQVTTQTGTDDFGAPVYSDTTETVENVLVSPVATNDVVSELQLSGKRAEYELCIPKGDAHIWENRVVEFFGRKWRTIGLPQEYIADLLPLAWNRKVRVERYE